MRETCFFVLGDRSYGGVDEPRQQGSHQKRSQTRGRTTPSICFFLYFGLALHVPVPIEPSRPTKQAIRGRSAPPRRRGGSGGPRTRAPSCARPGTSYLVFDYTIDKSIECAVVWVMWPPTAPTQITEPRTHTSPHTPTHLSPSSSYNDARLATTPSVMCRGGSSWTKSSRMRAA